MASTVMHHYYEAVFGQPRHMPAVTNADCPSNQAQATQLSTMCLMTDARCAADAGPLRLGYAG